MRVTLLATLAGVALAVGGCQTVSGLSDFTVGAPMDLGSLGASDAGDAEAGAGDAGTDGGVLGAEAATDADVAGP